MQYKSTTGGVVVQRYAVVQCDIDREEGDLMLTSYTLFPVYLAK